MNDGVDEFDYERERLEERLARLGREGLSRRALLRLAGLSGLAALGACTTRRAGPAVRSSPGTSGVPPATAAGGARDQDRPWSKPLPEDRFVIHGTNAEMRWERMRDRGYLTGTELFFVRNHSRTPLIDRSDWRLRIGGSGVRTPLELTYDELLDLPAVTSVVRAVECAGNGRVFFSEIQGKEAKGTPWRLGGIGVAEWTGVALGEVLERAGLASAARDVMPAGLDDLKVRRPMPVAKAMADDTILAFAMNGDELPADHGAPVRMIVPGWIGVASVKWVGSIEVSDEPLFSNWNTTTYVLIGPDYQPEGSVRGPILTTQTTKSALELPWPARLPSGRHRLSGRSWAGAGTIAKVEVRVDGATPGAWRRAQLHGENLPTAWARWSLDWEATPGEHKVSVRATDDRGKSQPDSVPFNEQGYLYGAVVAHPVSVT